MNKKQKKTLARIVLAAVLVVTLGLLPIRGSLRLALYLLTYLVIGSDILKKAGRGILNRQVFDENFLMAVATVGAFALAIYTRSGDYTEAIAVMLFYQIGELFQSYAVGKSRKNISALMDIRPDYANIERDGRLEQVDPEEVVDDLNACNDKIEAVTGVRPTLVRLPYGDYDDNAIRAVRSIGMEPIQWDVDSLDWKELPAQEIAQRVTGKVQPGSIVLFHNAAKHTPEALPSILTALIQEGYTFVPISQIILDGEYTIDHTGRQCPA